MYKLANPTRFLKWSRFVVSPLYIVALVLALVGLYLALIVSPADYQQKDSVRIMYIHVPAAQAGLFIYIGMGIAALVGLVWRHPLAEVGVIAAAPVGMTMVFLGLVTGAIWGKPTWGAYWVWDARLTSFLLLFFIYAGVILLARAFDDPAKGRRMAAIFTLIGLVNLPIIYGSVYWWNTLHQAGSIVREGGPRMPASMYMPLLYMSLAYTAFYIALILQRVQTEIFAMRNRNAMISKLHRLEQEL